MEETKIYKIVTETGFLEDKDCFCTNIQVLEDLGNGYFKTRCNDCGKIRTEG